MEPLCQNLDVVGVVFFTLCLDIDSTITTILRLPLPPPSLPSQEFYLEFVGDQWATNCLTKLLGFSSCAYLVVSLYSLFQTKMHTRVDTY